VINFSARKNSWHRKLFLVFLLLLSFVATAQTNNLAHPTFQLPKEAQTHIKQNLSTAHAKVPDSSQKSTIYYVLYYFFIILALSGFIPVVTFFIQYNLAGVHAVSNHLKKCKNYTPNIAIIIPSWNEDLVLEHTLDILLKMHYPLEALRIYIIDDGSIDNTQEILMRMQQIWPDNIFHMFKEGAGKGKAYVVNYGLKVILSEPWAEAVLFIDADISFKKDALRRMARHLADPSVGAVTAYIKVGNRSINYITRSIGFEYIVSQSVARRAQNVLGVIACLAGGAQLHTRANLETLGGEINTTTLAEDTYTTFATQKAGKKVIYEGNAFVYAEEPTTIIDLWKQRFRWGRGNLQITRAFSDFWFRPSKSSLGNPFFAIIWFCIMLAPLLMITSAIGLVGLFILDKHHSAHIFFYLASVSLFVYLYTTIMAILIDKRTSRLSWFQGIIYPGLISLSILIFSVNPDFFFHLIDYLLNTNHTNSWNSKILLFMESWSALCMLFAYIVFRLELMGIPTRITNFLLLIVGYGPLLCTINLAAFFAEIKKPNLRWDKTEKISTKRVIYPHHEKPLDTYDFESVLHRDKLREYQFLCRQIVSLLLVGALFLLLFYF